MVIKEKFNWGQLDLVVDVAPLIQEASWVLQNEENFYLILIEADRVGAEQLNSNGLLQAKKKTTKNSQDQICDWWTRSNDFHFREL